MAGLFNRKSSEFDFFFWQILIMIYVLGHEIGHRFAHSVSLKQKTSASVHRAPHVRMPRKQNKKRVHLCRTVSSMCCHTKRRCGSEEVKTQVF